MFGEASDAISRRFGSYEVAGTIAEPRSSDGSTIFIAIARPAKPERDASGKLALSFSPSKPNEPTKTFARPVVIKQISSSLTSDKAKLEVFLAAARAATTLRHPNVVEVESVGTDGNDVYLVEDYLLGETVASLLRRLQAEGDRLKPPLAAYIASQVCSALDAGHSAGLVHSRLTPHDIFIGYDGTVQVLDIGIADARVKLADDRISGTELEYASPEVCRNETVDPRTDVFTLGVMLWELLSGLSPFERPKDEDVVRAICDETVVPPKNIVPGLPTELSVITLQALHRDRGIRFQTAKAMAGALDAMVTKYIVGKPADHLAKVMKKLFADRENDKRDMLKRVMAGQLLDGLNFKAADRSMAPARKLALPAPVSAARVPAPPAAAHPADTEEDSTSVISVHTMMTPAKSKLPAPGEDDQPSVIIKANPDPGAGVGTMISTLPSSELRLDDEQSSMAGRGGLELNAAPMILDDDVVLRPTKRASGGLMVAIIGGVVALMIGVVVLLSRKGEDSKTAKKASVPSASVAARESPPPAPAPEPVPAPVADPTPATTTSTTSAEGTETTLHIETIPAQAAIFIAGTKRGMSPADIRVAKGSDPIVVEIRHTGYSTLKEPVVPDQNQRLKLTLLAKGGKAPATAPTPAASVNPYKKFE